MKLSASWKKLLNNKKLTAPPSGEFEKLNHSEISPYSNTKAYKVPRDRIINKKSTYAHQRQLAQNRQG